MCYNNHQLSSVGVKSDIFSQLGFSHCVVEFCVPFPSTQVEILPVWISFFLSLQPKRSKENKEKIWYTGISEHFLPTPRILILLPHFLLYLVFVTPENDNSSNKQYPRAPQSSNKSSHTCQNTQVSCWSIRFATNIFGSGKASGKRATLKMKASLERANAEIFLFSSESRAGKTRTNGSEREGQKRRSTIQGI